MINIFENPEKYLKYLWKVKIDEKTRKTFDGKSMSTVWLTKLCSANCKHCFSKPPQKYDKCKINEYQFSLSGVKKLIQFINESNCAYLMISGGGEPMFYKEAVYEIIEKAETEKIVIVTNGMWGSDYYSAKEMIDSLYQKFTKRTRPCELVIRVSVDSFHKESLGIDMILNIFNVFKNFYSTEKFFRLMFHSIIGDITMEKVVSKIPNAYLENEIILNSSDSTRISKVVPQKRYLKSDRYRVQVGYAKLFYPDFLVDIDNSDIESLSKIFDEDIIISEHGNPAITFNSDGTVGLDFWIKYNGNVTTWGNQLSEENYNIYLDTYDKIKIRTLDNILSFSLLDKGYFYRENIVKEVNPKAVMRSKAVQLRNYSSALLLEENHTKLYYGLRVIEDYILDGILKIEDLKILPSEMREMIIKGKETMMSFYNQANYDIIKQYMRSKENKKDWDMLFTLIEKGHYYILEDHIQMAINFYNERFDKKVTSIMENIDIEYDEFQERLSYVRKEVLDNNIV